MNDISEINAYISAARGAVALFKDFWSALPAGKSADEAAKQIETAENALRTAEAQLAKALGYHLCQCTFPPQIMLSIGRHERYGDEIFRCPNCNKQEPSEHLFRKRAEADAALSDWRPEPLA